MFDNCSIISVGVSSVWESSIIGSVWGSISDWWNLSYRSNGSACNQRSRLNVWCGDWGSVWDWGSVLYWSGILNWSRGNSNWGLNNRGLSELCLFVEKYLSFDCLVFNSLDVSLLRNVLGFNIVSHIGDVLSLDLDWVVIGNSLGFRDLDLDMLSLVFDDLLLVGDVLDSWFSSHWLRGRSYCNLRSVGNGGSSVLNLGSVLNLRGIGRSVLYGSLSDSLLNDEKINWSCDWDGKRSVDSLGHSVSVWGITWSSETTWEEWHYLRYKSLFIYFQKGINFYLHVFNQQEKFTRLIIPNSLWSK